MYEMDKAAFGAFLAGLRKQKGMTQKELASRLFVSDKAVSKWERGLSIPDVTLLEPLAEQLEVTVTELLRARAHGERGAHGATGGGGPGSLHHPSLRRHACQRPPLAVYLCIWPAVGRSGTGAIVEGWQVN